MTLWPFGFELVPGSTASALTTSANGSPGLEPGPIPDKIDIIALSSKGEGLDMLSYKLALV